MICINCGREIDDSEYCPFCGAEACLPDVQPEKEELEENWKAVISLLSGIGAWLLLYRNLLFMYFFEFDYLNCLFVLMLIAGIIFGILAYKDPRVKKRGYATIGLTCSILATSQLFYILLIP